MDIYSYISENGVIREIADASARTKNAEQDLLINEVTLKTNRLAGYSELETQVGTWIDGSLIYRRVLVVQTAFTLATDWINIVPYCGNPTLNMAALIYCMNTLEVGAYMKMSGPNSIIWGRQGSYITVPVGTAFIIEYTKAG